MRGEISDKEETLHFHASCKDYNCKICPCAAKKQKEEGLQIGYQGAKGSEEHGGCEALRTKIPKLEPPCHKSSTNQTRDFQKTAKPRPQSSSSSSSFTTWNAKTPLMPPMYHPRLQKVCISHTLCLPTTSNTSQHEHHPLTPARSPTVSNPPASAFFRYSSSPPPCSRSSAARPAVRALP